MTASALVATPAISLPEDRPSYADHGTRVSFTGEPRAFLSLLVRGALLQIPTFGFYRFWLITRMRRHLWANTRIGGESFDYTGTGKELLIGFLIAMAILVPIYIAYAILGLVAESLQAFGSVPLVLVLYTLGQFGVYRARRYRASRTVFRGLRFWMTGSGWGYAFRAVGWGLLSLVTLGAALPWASAALERYKMRRTRFGTLQGDFVGTGWQLAQRVWHLWLLAVAAPIGLIAALVVAAAGGAAPPSSAGIGVIGALLLATLIYPFFLATYARWHANGIRFGAVAVHSDLRTGAFFAPFVKFIGSVIALLAAFVIGAALVGFALGDQVQTMAQGELTVASVGIVVAFALGYLALLLGVGIVSRYFMTRGLWAILVRSITISNVAAIDEAVAAGDQVNAFGEAFADALDFGGGL